MLDFREFVHVTIQLEGYNCIYQKGIYSRKSGLVIYLKEEFEYEVKMNCNT